MNMFNHSKALNRLLDRTAEGTARPLGELIASDEPLRGADAQSVRYFFEMMLTDPIEDLDAFGVSVYEGDIAAVKENFTRRVARLRETHETDEEAERAAAAELYYLRYGETYATIYNIILLALLVNPQSRLDLLELTRFLVNEAQVPIYGHDASGTTVFAHALGTMPFFEPDFAQILYDANADVMAKNRYGATAAHSIVLLRKLNDEGMAKKAADAMEWFLTHGGNIDVSDNDKLSPRMIIEAIRECIRQTPSVRDHPLLKVVDREDERRAKLEDKCCKFCGREPEGETKVLACGRCRKVRYCSSPRKCQHDDWPVHKKGCKKSQ